MVETVREAIAELPAVSLDELRGGSHYSVHPIALDRTIWTCQESRKQKRSFVPQIATRRQTIEASTEIVLITKVDKYVAPATQAQG